MLAQHVRVGCHIVGTGGGFSSCWVLQCYANGDVDAKPRFLFCFFVLAASYSNLRLCIAERSRGVWFGRRLRSLGRLQARAYAFFASVGALFRV